MRFKTIANLTADFEFITRIVGADRNEATSGVAPEIERLRPFEDFNARNVILRESNFATAAKRKAIVT